jgi:hypothetical protein
VSAGFASPLRPLGVAEILDGAVRAVRRNLRAALALSAPVAIVRTVAAGALQYATIDSRNAAVWQLFGGLLTSLAFGTLLTGLLAPVFSADLLGQRLGAGAALARLRGRIAALVGLVALLTVAEEAGAVALVVGGVWLWGVWAVAAPALVLERTGVRGALKRSFALVRTQFWRTWGVRALGYVVTYVLTLFITLPFSALAAFISGTDVLDTATKGISDPGLFVTIVAVGSLLAITVTAPITSAIDVLLYTDLRVRREGMDIVLALDPGRPDAPATVTVTAW